MTTSDQSSPTNDFVRIAAIERRLQSPSRRSATVAAKELNDLLIPFHVERVRELGTDDSGLYDHYKALLDTGRIIGVVEPQIAELVDRMLPRFDSYYVIRAGLGELAAILADLGLRINAYDPTYTRVQAMDSGMKYLSEKRKWPADRLTVNQGVVPEPGIGRTLCIAYHALFGFLEIEDETLPAKFERYDAILFEPRMLGRVRQNMVEQDALIEGFRMAGFSHVQHFRNLELVFCAKPSAITAPFDATMPPDSRKTPIVTDRAGTIDLGARPYSQNEVTVDTIGECVLDAMTKLYTEEGQASGFYSYYEWRVEHRTPFVRYEIDVSHYVIQNLATRRVLEVGIGLGELPIILAAHGIMAGGIECDYARYRAACLIRSGVSRFFPQIEHHYDVMFGKFPDDLPPAWTGPDVVLLFTNVASWDEILLDAAIKSLPRFGEVILDLRLFGIVRDDPTDRQRLFDSLGAQAREAERLPDLSPGVDFARFVYAP